MSDRGSADGGDGAGVVRHEAPAIELHRHKRVCILVLGMHRSGTSAFTRVLSLLGAQLPKKLLGAGIGNETGHWESEPLVAFHDRMLAVLDSRWDDWRKLDFERFGSARLASIRDDLAHVLEEQYGSAALLVLKDPRICRFVPLYKEALADLGLEPRCVIPLRNPLAVVASLGARNGMTEGFATLLWLRHVLEAEAETRGWPRSIVSYEALLADWQSVMQRTTARLGLAWPRPLEEAAAEVAAFLSAEHQHHAPSRRELAARQDVADWVKAAYEALLRLEQDQDDELAFAQLDRIREEFAAVCPAFGAAMFAELAAREARQHSAHGKLSSEVSSIGQLLDLREKELAQARNEVVASSERIGALRVKAAVSKRRTLVLKGALAQRSTTIRSIQGELAARDKRLGALLAELASQNERAVALDSMLIQRDRQIVALHKDVASRDERIGEAQAALALKDNEVGSVREEVSRRDERIAELEAALAERSNETLQADLRSVTNTVRDKEFQIARLEAQYDAIIASTSWRITTPLRKIKSITRFRNICNIAWRGIERIRRKGLASIAILPSLKSDYAVIRKSGLFDKDWYLRQYPDIANAKIDPIEHYLSQGAKETRDPGPAFSTEGYYSANPDVRATGVNPLWHYVRYGKAEGRSLGPIGRQRPRHDEFPDVFPLKTFKPAAPIAVVVHVYYPELWEELSTAIRNVPRPFDLFVTLVRDRSDGLRTLIKGDFPSAQVLIFPNHGRDVYPFVCLNNTGLLCKYELVCKVHSKRSPHRSDGPEWRKSLISSLLGDRARAQTIIDAFSDDPDLGIVAGDGNVFTREYWGSNAHYVDRLAKRAHLEYRVEEVKFAAGSMFWIHPLILRILMSLQLTEQDFDIEDGQLDGTMAHAVERLLGIVAQQTGMKVLAANELPLPLRQQSKEVIPERVRLIAFYLPQFHPIPENDLWWGPGFTEWNNVTKSAPLFRGHRQPRLPSELGFYDLRLPDVRKAQAALARSYGIDAFCYYYYWFSGRRLLERPLEEMVQDGQSDFPFCLCWANENWTRSWDGLNRDVLVAQTYSKESLTLFATEMVRYFMDPRYLRYRDRPVLLVYRLSDIPNYKDATRQWRQVWKQHGIEQVHLCAVRFHTHELPNRPEEAGLDAYVAFPPHGVTVHRLENELQGLADDFSGLVYSYRHVIEGDLARHASSEFSSLHRTVMLGWDNTARRGTKAHICHGATPANFRYWLRSVVKQETSIRPNDEHLVFINAWNEWAEGTYLEPDTVYGRGFLEAVRSVRR